MGDFRIDPLPGPLGATVKGLNLASGIDDLDVAALAEASARYGVLVFPSQALSVEEHISFSRRFGDLEVHPLSAGEHAHPEILVVSNIVENGKPVGVFEPGVEDWHSDMFWSERPAKASLLYARRVPPSGGDTLFAAGQAAYDALSAEVRERVEDLWGRHSLDLLTTQQREATPWKSPLTPEQRALAPDVLHPLVRTHPVTGRRSLFIETLGFAGVVGLDEADGRELVEGLLRHVTQPRFVYRHHWREGDLVMWDNYSTLHTASPCSSEHPRLLHRTTVRGPRAGSLHR